MSKNICGVRVLWALVVITTVLAGTKLLEINAREPKPATVTDDSPKSTKLDPVKLSPTVQLLLNEDFKVQQQAHERILKERSDLIAQLTTIISDPYNHRSRPSRVTFAMSILGEMRAPEAVEALVTYIGFPEVHHPDAGEYPDFHSLGDLNKTITQRCPAVPALIQIGEPCVDEVIQKLAKADHLTEIDACQTVLKKLGQHPSVRSQLEEAVKQNKTRKRPQLERALEKLDEVDVAPKK